MLEFDFGLSEGAITLLFTMLTLLQRSGYMKRFKISKKESDDRIIEIKKINAVDTAKSEATINYLLDYRIEDLTRRLELETDPDERFKIQEKIDQTKDKRL